MYDYEKAFKSAYKNANLQNIAQGNSHQACNCIGPQNGQPACPCAMRNVRIVDGRWVRIEDLGPAKESV
jgi:hypothetical protein